jgi:hypothetical protein
MFRKILYAVFAIIAVLVVVGFVLPRQVHVERSIVVDRPPPAVFPYANSLRRFNEWSPWADIDPAAKITFDGPDSGVGSRMHWAGNKKVGVGTDTIVESAENRHVGLELDFGPQGKATSTIELTPTGGGTRVRWTLDMDVGAGPVGRYVGLFMDRIIGPDYERGLAKLKHLAEAAAP